MDSIPAVFAITQDPFIVYTANLFAILGLGALYFLLASVMEMFRYPKVALSFVLCFVGIKMLLVDFYKIPISLSCDPGPFRPCFSSHSTGANKVTSVRS